MMGRMILCAMMFSVAALAGEPAGAITPTEKIELFNGKDMAGWVPYHKENKDGSKVDASKIWTVKDGVLHCVGKPNGYLRTEKSYAQYKVTVEWRFAKAGNTGVLVHMNPPEKVWPLCVECQGMHAFQGDMYFWSGAKADDIKGVKLARKGADAEKPVGEWNTYQVLCDGTTITILVNGKEVNKATNCSLTSGQIGIQCEGAQIEVKHVTLEPLGK